MQCVVTRWWFVNGFKSDLAPLITLPIATIESISGPLLRNSLENCKASGDSSQHKKLVFLRTNIKISFEILSHGHISYLDNLGFSDWHCCCIFEGWLFTIQRPLGVLQYCSRMKSSSSCLFRTPRTSSVHTGLGKIHYREGWVCITYWVRQEASVLWKVTLQIYNNNASQEKLKLSKHEIWPCDRISKLILRFVRRKNNFLCCDESPLALQFSRLFRRSGPDIDSIVEIGRVIMGAKSLSEPLSNHHLATTHCTVWYYTSRPTTRPANWLQNLLLLFFLVNVK